MTLLAQSITTESGLLRPKMTSLYRSVPSRSTSWSFSNSLSACPSFAAFRPPLLMAISLSASSVISSHGKTSPMLLPTPVVSPNDALLLRFILHFESLPLFLPVDVQSLLVHIFFLFCRAHIVDSPVLRSYVATYHIGRST